jgi:4-hydroxy-tetrahydrodipicolinate reductase
LGKVGKEVRRCAEADEDLAVVGAVDETNDDVEFAALAEAPLRDVDVVIDFSGGDAVLALVEAAAAADPSPRLVVGSSGWGGDEKTVRRIVLERDLSFLHGANFSIGTAVFMRLADAAADLLARAGGFDVALLDVHHRHKKDMPSGTALRIAAAVAESTAEKTGILTGTADRPIASDELHVACLRVGENMGYHELIFDAPGEVIRLSQQTRGRDVYAVGAILAAKWLMRREEPSFYTFDQALEDMLYG